MEKNQPGQLNGRYLDFFRDKHGSKISLQKTEPIGIWFFFKMVAAEVQFFFKAHLLLVPCPSNLCTILKQTREISWCGIGAPSWEIVCGWVAFRNFFYKFLIHFPLSSILSFSIRFTKHLTQYPLLHVKRPCEIAFAVVCLSRSPKKTALATKALLLSDDVSKVALNILPSSMVTVSTMPSIALTSKLVNRFGRFKPDWFPNGLSKCWFLSSALLPQFQWGPYCVGLPYRYFSKIQDKNRQNTFRLVGAVERTFW